MPRTVYTWPGRLAGSVLRGLSKRVPSVFWNEVTRAYRAAHADCPDGAPCEWPTDWPGPDL